MKITDLKCAVIGNNPVVRVVTDEGIDGFGEVESSKHYLKPHVMFYKNHILGEDPTNVEWVMMKIRRLGSFKPWGSAVSAIEMALWDLAGKAANLPVYKLLGGKVRDQVRVYNGAVRFPMSGIEPEHYTENMVQIEGFAGRVLDYQARGGLSRSNGATGAGFLLWRSANGRISCQSGIADRERNETSYHLY